jgi:hypothetical protein
MHEIGGVRFKSLLSEMIDSPLQIGRIPQNDGGDRFFTIVSVLNVVSRRTNVKYPVSFSSS